MGAWDDGRYAWWINESPQCTPVRMTDDRFRDLMSGRGMGMLQALIDMNEGVKGDVGPRYF